MTTPPVNHYHVRRHSEDEDPYITDDLFSALDYAATELDNMADFEHDGISACGEQGDYESAYEAFVKCERYNNLMMNARNMVKQKGAFYADRAPLYQVNSADWVGRVGNELADARDAADARLFESAIRTAGEINSGSPIGIGQCDAPMRTWPDEDQMHGGESYCADEYPDGYAGYDTPPLNLQDGPCGDR
jgi:hypothetical protein